MSYLWKYQVNSIFSLVYMSRNMLALLHLFLPILVSGGELHCGSSICPVISANLEAILVSSILETIMNWIECSMSWFQDTRKILGCCTHDGCLPGHWNCQKLKDRASEVVSHPPPLKKKRILELLHLRSCKSCLLSAVGVQAGALLETELCWE